MGVPNIFTYATKELSQDAVICWLVACARHAPRGELRNCGIAFVKELMRSGNSRVINAQTGESENLFDGDLNCIVEGPLKQYSDSNIDIYFRVEWGDNLVSVIVEDKIDGEIDDEQLESHLDAIMGDNDNVEQNFVKAVCLKTGYVYHDEREEADNKKFCVFDANNIVDFFIVNKKWLKTHAFLQDFAERIQSFVKDRNQALANWELDKDFVQWEFMVALGNALQPREEGWLRWPARGLNNDGRTPWTQFPHWKNRGAIFWRLDSERPEKSLRLMVNTDKVMLDTDEEERMQVVLELWNAWSEKFDELARQSGLISVTYQRRTTRNENLVREGTIGAVDIRSCLRQEGIDSCVQKVSDLYSRFIEARDIIESRA